MGPSVALLALLAATPAPLADQLLWPTYSWDIVGGRLSVSRGAGPNGPRLLEDSLTAANLAELLAASPRAAELARDAHRELQWGVALKYSGLLGALAGVVGITIGAAQITDGNAQKAWSTGGGILALAGVVSTVLGVVGINDGFARALEAVNAYNVDLVRGR